MEVLDIELVAQRRFGLAAYLADLELPDLVGQRLSRNGHKTLRFRYCLSFRPRGIGQHVVKYFLACPLFRMQACVDHQSDRTPQFRIQRAEILVGIRVDAKLLAQ